MDDEIDVLRDIRYLKLTNMH